MKIATWNVNGIRARELQLVQWIESDRPDILCLQEIKANPAQVPETLAGMQDYWSFWHGERAYSGVSLHLCKSLCPVEPKFSSPPFDFENRIITAQIGNFLISSIYVPNGGKDFGAKIRFLEAMERYVADSHASGLRLLLCGDLNVTRSDMDVHPKQRNPDLIGQRPEERELIEHILSHGLVDLGRALHPDDESIFTWWAPWRKLRERNIGWRIDYILTSGSMRAHVEQCSVLSSVGTSDHAPVMATFSCGPESL